MEIRYGIKAYNVAPEHVLDALADSAELAFNVAIEDYLKGLKHPIGIILSLQEELGTISRLIVEIDDAIKAEDETKTYALVHTLSQTCTILAGKALTVDISANEKGETK
jgi:hypothetical protein